MNNFSPASHCNFWYIEDILAVFGETKMRNLRTFSDNHLDGQALEKGI